LVDGATLRMQTDFPKGDPQNRLSGEGDERQVPLRAVPSDGELDAVEGAVSAIECDGSAR
jgi:hypothetical protein